MVLRSMYNYHLLLREVAGKESRSVGGPHYDTMSNCNLCLHGSCLSYACFHHGFAFAYSFAMSYLVVVGVA